MSDKEEITIEPMDSSEFSFALDGVIRFPSQPTWNSGRVWWLFDTPRESFYVVVSDPQLVPDCDEDGHHFSSPDWDEITVVTLEGERQITDEESDYWTDWICDQIRDLCSR